MGQAISKLTIKGYKSIRNLENFELRNLNILIGPNGAGKSNFVSFFELLQAIPKEKGLPNSYIQVKGGADILLYRGPKLTQSIEAGIVINNLPEYRFVLSLTVKNDFSIGQTIAFADQNYTHLKPQDINKHFSSFIVYHFHDTSDFAKVKLPCLKQDYEYLRPDAGNLAAFLLRLKGHNPKEYDFIKEAIQLAAPFFDDFILKDYHSDPDKTLLEWKQKETNDYPFQPSQISDGTLRFICLATTLLQPFPPSIILLDEPELGLHPYALAVLAGLIQKAAARTQVIVSTQSAGLLDHFQPEDIILVERKNGESVFSRPDTEKLKIWLEDYSLGNIWSRNIIEGRPVNE